MTLHPHQLRTNIARITLAAILLTCLLLSLTACGGTLATIAKAEADITAGCTTAYTVVATANSQGLISTPDAAVIMNVLLQIELANKQALAATASISTLSASNSATLLNIVTPIDTALQNLISNGLAGIKDPATQAKVKLGLTTIQTAITAIVTVLKAVK
jgi:hypothetical protein